MAINVRKVGTDILSFIACYSVHLEPERHDVELQKLMDAAKIGSWREKDDGAIKITMN